MRELKVKDVMSYVRTHERWHPIKDSASYAYEQPPAAPVASSLQGDVNELVEQIADCEGRTPGDVWQDICEHRDHRSERLARTLIDDLYDEIERLKGRIEALEARQKRTEVRIELQEIGDEAKRVGPKAIRRALSKMADDDLRRLLGVRS